MRPRFEIGRVRARVKILDSGGGGGVFGPLPSHWRVSWSDSLALTERAALCHAIRAHLALTMIDEAGILSVSIPIDDILLYFLHCR